MKNVITILALSLGTFYAGAQITLTESNTPRSGDYSETRNINQGGISSPALGANALYDYSGLSVSPLTIDYEYFASTRPGFENFTRYSLQETEIAGDFILGEYYDHLDATGYNSVGTYLHPKNINLLNLTGNINDSLSFPGGNMINPNPMPITPFPFSYGDQIQESQVTDTPFELTAAVFGLNQTPGTLQQEFQTTIEGIGYGQLILPMTGGQSIPYDVLLVKNQQILIDSVMLGGAPAGPQIMNAFGLVQGDTTMVNFYKFYAEGFESTIFTLAFDKTWTNVIYASYNPSVLTLDQGVGLSTNSLSEGVSLYPNPAMDQITVSSVSNIHKVVVYDLTGKEIKSISVKASETNTNKLKMDVSGLSTGAYFLKAASDSGTVTKKLVINK